MDDLDKLTLVRSSLLELGVRYVVRKTAHGFWNVTDTLTFLADQDRNTLGALSEGSGPDVLLDVADVALPFVDQGVRTVMCHQLHTLTNALLDLSIGVSTVR